jgi:hypothetical protein
MKKLIFPILIVFISAVSFMAGKGHTEPAMRTIILQDTINQPVPIPNFILSQNIDASEEYNNLMVKVWEEHD